MRVMNYVYHLLGRLWTQNGIIIVFLEIRGKCPLRVVHLIACSSFKIKHITLCTIDMRYILLLLLVTALYLHPLHGLKHLVVEAAMEEVLVAIRVITE